MTPDRWDRVKSVFFAAHELPVERRDAYVATACGDDDALREQVTRLLGIPEDQPAAVDRPPFGDVLANFAVPRRPLFGGEELGARFRILRRVGVGGMGEVHEAEDLQLGGRVALKTVLPEIAADPKVIARFRKEIQLARQVTHPNVCRVFDFMQMDRSEGGTVDFLTMEFLDGETLADRLRARGKFTFADALPVLEQMIAGLAAAHRAGVVHRDFKSANIFLAKDAAGGLRVAITDFGLARSLTPGDGHSAVTGGWGIGTPMYMAPEHVEGKAVGASADQYALGVVMYEMATGAGPFAGDSPLQLAIKRTREKPAPPRLLNPALDPVWESVILRCLEYEPSDRFANVDDVWRALQSGRTRNFLRRSAVRRWGVAVPAAAIVLAGALWAIDRWRQPEPLPADVARLYQEGVMHVQNGSWYRAKAALEMAVAAKPNFAEGRARLAESFLELDQYDAARAEILKATDLPKRSRNEDLLVRGTRGLVLREFPKACESFAARTEGNAGLLDLARCQDKAYQTDAAHATFSRVLAADPSSPAALLGLAALENRRSRPAESLKLLDQAQASYERTQDLAGLAELRLQRAAIFDQQSRLPEARAEAERAAAASSAIGNVYIGLRVKLLLASLAVKLGDGAGGKQLAAEAVEQARAARLETTLAKGFVDLSSTFYTQRQYVGSMEYAQQGLELAERAGARSVVALAQWRTAAAYAMLDGKSKDAYPLLDKADAFFREAGMRRELLLSRSARAGALFVDDEIKATAVYREIIPEAQALGDVRTEANAVGNLAKLAQLRGDYKRAVEQYQRAAELLRKAGQMDRYLFNRVRLADNQARMGDFNVAIPVLQETLQDPALRDDGVRLVAMRTLAMAYSSQLRSQQADDGFAAALAFAAKSKQPADVVMMQVSRCVVAAEAGWVEKARQRCQELVPLLQSPRQQAELSDVVTALAIAELDARQYRRAITQAEEARRLAVAAKQERNAWYARLIEADARRRMGDTAGYQLAASKAREEMTDLAKRWGEPAAKAYLARPGIARRWQVVLQ